MATKKLTRVGWILFAISGGLFLVPAIRAADLWTTAGCVLWLIAVGIFLWIDTISQ